MLAGVLCSCSGGTRAEAAAGDTALILAASEGREDVVNDLVRRGVDVNAGHDANGDTALMAAIRHAPGLRAVLDDFCRKGVPCKVSFLSRIAWDGVRGAFGRPAVTPTGVFERYLRIMTVLLEHGADPNAVTASGATPLTLGASMGHGRVVRLLLDHGADVNATDGAMGDSTALILAVQNGNSAMVKAVLEKHPDLTPKDRFGKSALDYAIEENEQWAIDMLRQAGER